MQGQVIREEVAVGRGSKEGKGDSQGAAWLHASCDIKCIGKRGKHVLWKEGAREPRVSPSCLQVPQGSRVGELRSKFTSLVCWNIAMWRRLTHWCPGALPWGGAVCLRTISIKISFSVPFAHEHLLMDRFASTG